jgi:S-adenosylmethionine decarboxylase
VDASTPEARAELSQESFWPKLYFFIYTPRKYSNEKIMNNGVVFEGSEKKLEIAFLMPAGESLRSLPRAFWASVVQASGAQILSELSNLEVDAYLLSESSLFVFRDRIVMITCGRTKLIEAAKLAIRKLGVSKVDSVFFERKNEAFPDAQITSFDQDAADLKKIFPQGQIHTVSYPAIGGFVRIFQWGRDELTREEARTFELLMHGIDPRVLVHLKDTNKLNRTKWSKILHFESVFPNYFVDEFWFEPCGYSINGICKNDYFTIHITPEKEASYVSLEFNRSFASDEEFKRAIQTVLNVFNPQLSVLIQFNHLDDPYFQLDSDNPEYSISQPEILHLYSSVAASFQTIAHHQLSDPQFINLRRNKKSAWIQNHRLIHLG